MDRAQGQSIAQAGTSHQPGLNRELRRWLAKELGRLKPEIEASAKRVGADRYRKHFYSFSHTCLLLFHGLSGGPSLRQSFAAFALCPGLVKRSGLEPEDSQDEQLGVSFSQFAESNTSRPANFLGGIVPSLIKRVREMGPLPDGIVPADLHVLDSTFIRVSLLLAPWLPSKGGSDVPGLRMQLQYSPALDLPEQVLLTDTHTSDCEGLDRILLDNPLRIAEMANQTLVTDLGYYSHTRFARLLSNEIHLVSRLHPQASVQIEEELPVQQSLPTIGSGRITVMMDQRVTVGTRQNQVTGLRLVTAIVEPVAKTGSRNARAVTYRLLTDRFDLPAFEVVRFYLWRWQVELFIRWLKQQARLPSLLGYSRNAIELTVWLAIIVHLLTILAARAVGLRRRSPALLRQMIWALALLNFTEDQSPNAEGHQLELSLHDSYPSGPT